MFAFGLEQSKSDHSLFHMHVCDKNLGLVVYVHDILLASNSFYLVSDFKVHLGKHFNYKDLGASKYFLGL